MSIFSKNNCVKVKMFLRSCFLLVSIGLFIGCSNQSYKPSKSDTYIISPVGASLEFHSENSISWSDFQYLVARGRLSGKVIFKPGNYHIKQTINVRGSRPLDMVAEKGALFLGTFNFDKPEKVVKTFVLHRGDIKLENLNFLNVGSCISVAKNSTVKNVIIYNLKARNVHSCIVVDRHIRSYVHDWNIQKLNVTGYYRVAVRISGKYTYNFMLSDLYINGSHSFNNNHCFKGGVQIYNGAHDISINHTFIENNIGNCGESYQQGDGIEADNKGGIPYNLTFNNVVVKNSRDGNFDLKAENVRLSNIISVGGQETRYSFKLWSYKDYSCLNCQISGQFNYYITLISAEVLMKGLIINNGFFTGSFIKCQTTVGLTPPMLTIIQAKNLALMETNGSESCVDNVLISTLEKESIKL